MSVLETVMKGAKKLFSAVDKETEVLQELHRSARAVLNRFDEEKPGFKGFLKKAYGYAVFPSVGKAAAVLGGAYGKGEVFEQGKLIGYAAVAQLTIGVQLGGDTFAEVVVFENKETLDRFKGGKTAFAANASATLIKASATAANDFADGAAVYVHGEGGMLLEAAIGGQHFFYREAVLGKTREAPTARKKRGHGKPARSKSKSKRIRERHGRKSARPGSRSKTRARG